MSHQIINFAIYRIPVAQLPSPFPFEKDKRIPELFYINNIIRSEQLIINRSTEKSKLPDLFLNKSLSSSSSITSISNKFPDPADAKM